MGNLEDILMKKPIFLTGNKNKLAEAREILPFDFDNKNIDLDEIQSIDGRKVIGHKLDEAYSKLKRPVFVDDSALHIDSMNGFPGALYKFLDKAAGLDGICKIVTAVGKDRNAQAVTHIGYFDGKRKKFFEGKRNGTIARSPRGGSGFGFDYIFIPDGSKKAYSQIPIEEKNRISMRVKALNKFAKYLTKT